MTLCDIIMLIGTIITMLQRNQGLGKLIRNVPKITHIVSERNSTQPL